MARCLSLHLSALALLAFAPTSTQASEEGLVPIPNQTAITAYGGHVVWNELDPTSRLWYLTDWHGGAVSRLRLAPRSVQFDVDLGPDAGGRPTAVYSRCRHEAPPGGSLAIAPDWMSARGCDLYAFDLEAGKERRLRGTSSRRGSETTPSIWRGTLAFARRYSGKRKARLLLRRPGQRHLARLPGGTLPRCAPRLCAANGPRPSAGVDALDLGPRSLAFLWRLNNGNVVGVAGWELRTDPLGGGHGVIAWSGYVGGVCEIFLPQSPSAVGSRVLFLERIGKCTVTRTPIASFDPATGVLHEATPSSGLAYAIARDGKTIYWVRGPSPQPETAPGGDPCRIAPNACFLVRSSDLSFRRVRHRKAKPPVF
jgi:hypothetical protein